MTETARLLGKWDIPGADLQRQLEGSFGVETRWADWSTLVVESEDTDGTPVSLILREEEADWVGSPQICDEDDPRFYGESLIGDTAEEVVVAWLQAIRA